MSSSQSQRPDIESHPPLAQSSSNEDPEERDIVIDHALNHKLLLQDTNYTKHTVVAASQHHTEDVNEKGQQESGATANHVGFWHHDLNNVRLHVLRLWARTGKAKTCTHRQLLQASVR